MHYGLLGRNRMNYTNELLVGICDKLQLQPSLYELAKARYEVVSNIIESADVFKHVSLRMYSHGSFRLKTTVKPLKENEYDLDFVVELPSDANMEPFQLYDHIYEILTTDGVHNNMVEKKSRCIRIKYANDFHLDIMPGKAIDRKTNEIIVPDKKLQHWNHHSNPIGYAEWFENQAKTAIRKHLMEQRVLNHSAEPIEDQEVAGRLEPLRRAVQLIKRYRDLYCDRKDFTPVRSIVLCTLMGEINTSYSDEIQIIIDFCSYVNSKIKNAYNKPFIVRNPVVNEVLTEKWSEDVEIYNQFVDMMEALTIDIAKLKCATDNLSIISQLKHMFGENVTNDVVKAYAAPISEARKIGTLSADPFGKINTTKKGTNIKKNTFYGQ